MVVPWASLLLSWDAGLYFSQVLPPLSPPGRRRKRVALHGPGKGRGPASTPGGVGPFYCYFSALPDVDLLHFTSTRLSSQRPRPHRTLLAVRKVGVAQQS